MVIEEDRQELLAAARRVPNKVEVQVPDRPAEAPEYVKTAGAQVPAVNGAQPVAESKADATILKPIDNSVKTLQLTQTADTSGNGVAAEIKADPSAQADIALTLGLDLPDLKAGEKIKVPVMVDGTGKFRSAVLGLTFDAAKVTVRGVTYGEIFGLNANAMATPYLNQDGKMFVSLNNKEAEDIGANGTIAYVELEALVAHRPVIRFDRDAVNFMTAGGKNLVWK
jgi:hypothetical protein